MTDYYPYLISSLPYLHFGVRPPFSFEKFVSICARHIPEGDIEMLNSALAMQKAFYEGAQPTLSKWQAHETALRNEGVKIRASHKHLDPLKYLRGEGAIDLYLSHLVMSAHRSPSMLEAEKVLDGERWRFLDELSFGHYFDLDVLIIYGLKLLILERWEKINTADKAKVLEETLVKV